MRRVVISGLGVVSPVGIGKEAFWQTADVLYLHRLRERLDEMLTREGRMGLAQACFAFLPTRVELDLAGWGAEDIFAH